MKPRGLVTEYRTVLSSAGFDGVGADTPFIDIGGASEVGISAVKSTADQFVVTLNGSYLDREEAQASTDQLTLATIQFSDLGASAPEKFADSGGHTLYTSAFLNAGTLPTSGSVTLILRVRF